MKYSPGNYTAKIHRDKKNQLNGHRKTVSFSEPLEQLPGGDERDRRDRSYSNDTSISTVSDRWSSNREVKRRNNLLNTVHGGHDQIDCAAASSEVTLQDQNGDSDIPRNSHDNVNNINVDNDNNGNNNDRDNDTLDERKVIKDHDDNINNDDNLNHHGHPTSADKSRRLAVTSSSSSSLSSSASLTDSIWTSSPATESCDSSATTPLAAPQTSIDNFYLSATSGGGSGDPQVFSWTKTPINPDNTELFTNNNDQDCNSPIFGAVQSEVSPGDTLFERQASVSSARVNVHGCAAQWTNANDSNGHQINDEENEDGIDGGFEANLASSDISVDKINLEDVPLDDTLILSASDDVFKTPGSLDDNFRVTTRPTGNQDDLPKPSTSRTVFGGWDTHNNDFNTSSTSTTQPIDVHQPIYRGFNDQSEESSTSRSPRNRTSARRDESHGLNGLRNIGNTCFMNSVIQCLSNTRPLLEYLLNDNYLADINVTTSSMKGALIKAFAQVIHELWGNSGDHVVNTISLKTQIQRFAPRFMGYSQQDAQEFLRYLLEGLHEDVNRVVIKPQPILTDIPDQYTDVQKAAESWKRYLRSEDSTIVDVFVGQLRSSLHCTSCDHDSVTLDPFWDLSLPIPVRSGTVKLQQCLEHFTKVETLDGDEKPTCSKCQMRRKCTKSFSIQKFPKILVIHLKRFSPTERFRAKLSVLVDFPLEGLDLSAFAAPGVAGCTYNLYGVANHSGTPYSGHYTAYCKHPYSGEWHEYNDSSVSSVSQSSVVSSEAYVLFYEQQPLSHHL
ncbi:ubiquitin carboxyl-terminal hydrolase 2-like isoform X2 [Chelonus insularis]|nr:ubiquitin carboxyl-terminal hydrolase 2-like isoform X2 [Chelonus insularis]